MSIVKGCTRRALKLASVNDRSCEEEIFVVPRRTFKFSFHSVSITRMQFPVRVAFAGAAHKTQGQNLKKAVVDFISPLFPPGELNVDLCRVKKFSDLLLLHNPADTPHTAPKAHLMSVPVANPVFKEAVDLVQTLLYSPHNDS